MLDLQVEKGVEQPPIHRQSRIAGVEIMAMPQRDDTIEAIKRLDALLEYAVMHGDEEETERLREELRKLTDEV